MSATDSELHRRIAGLVEALCSDACAGRRTGTAGGRAARRLVRSALESTGLRVDEQPIQGGKGANLIAEVEGWGPLADRIVLVGAHYDHLGTGPEGEIYRGADDNAAAVAVLVEAARKVVGERGPGRRIVFVAFDAEEPPFFLGGDMGSEALAASGRVPLDRIDAMVAMDLVGHAVGPEGLPDEVRRSLFVLGAEKGELASLVDAPRIAVPGLPVRRLDAEIIPPLSDYEPFWRREVPFLFLTCGRSSVYHTPDDVPERLDYGKVALEARWLGGLALELAAGAPRARFDARRRDDRGTAATVAGLARALAPFSPAAVAAAEAAGRLLEAAERRALTEDERDAVASLVGGLESALG